MNEGPLKTRIFIMLAFDWVAFIAVTSLGIYSVLYSEKPEIMATAALIGLLLVAKIGDFLRVKIARLDVDQKIESRQLGKK